MQTQLNVRCGTDRAKGLLMAGQKLDVAFAYPLLRETAMQARLRLSEVARGAVRAAMGGVVQAAQQAQPLHLGGRQRMRTVDDGRDGVAEFARAVSRQDQHGCARRRP